MLINSYRRPLGAEFAGSCCLEFQKGGLADECTSNLVFFFVIEKNRYFDRHAQLIILRIVLCVLRLSKFRD